MVLCERYKSARTKMTLSTTSHTMQPAPLSAPLLSFMVHLGAL
jgi:hypothetical protein